MPKISFVAPAAIAAVFLSAPTTQAAGNTSGNACYPDVAPGSIITSVSNNPYGANNASTSNDLAVICPLNNDYNNPVRSIVLLAYDRNFSKAVTCTVSAFSVGPNGGLVGSWAVATTSDGTPNGAAIGGPGDGTMYQKSVTVPAGTPQSVWTARCVLPSAVSSGGTLWLSHIVGIQLAP